MEEFLAGFILAMMFFGFVSGCTVHENDNVTAIAHGYAHYDKKDNSFHWNNEE